MSASSVGLHSVPCPIVLSHWASLRLGSFKVFPQALDRFLNRGFILISKSTAKVQKIFDMCKFLGKKILKKCTFIQKSAFFSIFGKNSDYLHPDIRFAIFCFHPDMHIRILLFILCADSVKWLGTSFVLPFFRLVIISSFVVRVSST